MRIKHILQGATLALALSTSPMALAQTTGESPIAGVIQSQLDAFMADDFDTAFTFASPMIKQLFGNSSNFGAMVRQGYPMVWRPAEVQFLELRENGAQAAQNVLIRDGAGTIHLLEYEMIQTPDGWQINGVRFLNAGAFGA